MSDIKGVEAAWRVFCDRVHEAGQQVLAMEPLSNGDQGAEALHFLTRALRGALDFRLDGGDPRHPHLTWWDRTTAGAAPLAPNLDNSYVLAQLDGRETYRLSVPIDTIDEFNLSLHAANYGEEGFAEQWGNVTLTDLKAVDGRVDVIFSSTPHEGNWLQMPDRAKFMFLRIYYFDWAKGAPPAEPPRWRSEQCCCLAPAARGEPVRQPRRLVPDRLRQPARPRAHGRRQLWSAAHHFCQQRFHRQRPHVHDRRGAAAEPDAGMWRGQLSPHRRILVLAGRRQ